jgi:hypothetical protein
MVMKVTNLQFRVVTPCGIDLHVDTNVSEKHTAHIFMARDGRVLDETKVVGNHSA